MSLFEMTNLQQNFTGIMLLTVLLLGAGAITVRTNRSSGRPERQIFFDVIMTLLVITVIDWFTFMTNGYYPELRLFHTVLMTLMFVLAPTLPASIARAIYPSRRSDTIIFALLGVHAVLQVLNIFFGFIFWVDETNTYHRAPFYFIYVASYAMSGIYLVVQSIRAGRLYQSRNIIAVVAILLCMLLGVGIQIMLPNVHTSWTAVAMAVMLYFMYYCDMIMRCDALTRLLNRHSFEEFADNPQLPCTVTVIDIDSFKQVNDSYGHAFGDECLIQISRCILTAFGHGGRCYRIGGDEFCAIVTKQDGDAKQCAVALQDAMAKLRQRDKRIPAISIGEPIPLNAREDFAATFNAADFAMYSAKRAGRDED